MDITKDFFTRRVMKYLNRLRREVVKSPLLEVPETCAADVALWDRV